MPPPPGGIPPAPAFAPLLRIYLGAARVTAGEVDDNSVGVTIDFSSEFDRQSFALPGPRSIRLPKAGMPAAERWRWQSDLDPASW